MSSEMSEQESLLPAWMDVPEPVSNGLKTSELRAELVSECSASMQGREKDLAELLKTVLRGYCWREYVPAWLSHGPYGNIQEVRYESPARTAIKHKSFRDWIERGLRLARPEKTDPVRRLVLRIQSVFPEAYHAELIELVVKTAAEDRMTNARTLHVNGENQHTSGGFDKTENIKATHNGGTSAAYRLGKIKRDRPELAERIMAGEFKSVAEAERAVGLKPPKLTNYEKVQRAFSRLTEDEQERFREWLGNSSARN